MKLFAKSAVLAVLLVLFNSQVGYSQEEAPIKNFEYSIDVDHLKTDEQAQAIADQVNAIEGIENCSLVLIEYKLVFHTTNQAIENADVLAEVKEVVLRNNAQIVKINRKEE
jgi:hypothetical protein